MKKPRNPFDLKQRLRLQIAWRTRFVFCAFFLSFFSSCDEEFDPPPAVVTTDNFVDLRPQQTALRDQGSRTTCIVFAGIGAVEAAYRRIGYGEIDLSEEFNNFTRKSFYLHAIWSDYLARGEDAVETQLGSTGGGGGVGVVAELSKGFKVPTEDIMPYVNSDAYYPDNFAALRNVMDMQARDEQPKQRHFSNFNLDSLILNDDNLRAEKYYSVASYRDLANAKDPAEIERVLKRGIEVVWDFNGAAPWQDGGKNADGVWQFCTSCSLMAHSMLIVGFDKRDPDPSKHYFIVKNSWSSNTAAGLDGYTAISYDYVKNYGVAAAYITLVNPPTSWEELAFIGRWKLNYDGFKGELDIYHLPGMARYGFEYWFKQGLTDEVYDDYRIGTFYDNSGKAFKVNGRIDGNRIEFYFDLTKPLLRWDELSGRKFVYYLDGSNFMAGYHVDGDGSVWGGYARKAGYVSGGISTPRPFGDASYFNSKWNIYSEGVKGQILFDKNITSEFEDFYLLEGTYTSDIDGTKSKAQIKIPRDESNRTFVQIQDLGNGKGVGSFIGKHLSWEVGLITGQTPEIDPVRPFSMTRIQK